MEKKKENADKIAQLAGKAVALAFCIAIFGVVISKEFVSLAFRDEYHSIASHRSPDYFPGICSFSYTRFFHMVYFRAENHSSISCHCHHRPAQYGLEYLAYSKIRYAGGSMGYNCGLRIPGIRNILDSKTCSSQCATR